MEAGWECVFTTKHQYKAEMVAAMLGENDIPCVVINKNDTVIQAIGEIEIFVTRDDVMKAKCAIKELQP